MFYETLSDNLKQLLNDKLQKNAKVLSQFYLAGGTALALQRGHRKSDDLDFFCEHSFDHEPLIQEIVGLGGTIDTDNEGTIHSSVAGSKLSFLFYPYPLIGEKWHVGRISVASVDDIACMKVIAIAQRAEKKDFFDMYEILKTHSASRLKELVIRKYGESRINCYHVVKSVFYFADAERSIDPVSLNNTNWQQVKDYFLKNETELIKGLCAGVIGPL